MDDEDEPVSFLTVKDIATKIAFERSESGISRALRQVRHWTESGLLRTKSKKRTGKGIPRLYEEEPTLYVAAILYELVRYRATVLILKPVADELYEQWNEGSLPHFATALTDINSYLQVSWAEDPETGAFHDARIATFDDLELNSDNGTAAPFDATASSSVLINMSRVLDRILRN